MKLYIYVYQEGSLVELIYHMDYINIDCKALIEIFWFRLGRL